MPEMHQKNTFGGPAGPTGGAYAMRSPDPLAAMGA